MKKIISAFLLTCYFVYAFADTGDILKRRQMILDFKDDYEQMLKDAKKASEELGNYKNPKIVPSETVKLKDLQFKVEELKGQIESGENFLSLGNADKDIKKLQDVDQEIATFEKHQENLKSIGSGSYSKRLNIFIQQTNDRKYTLSKAAYITLSQEEKAIADEYQKSQFYILSNEQTYGLVKKEKKDLEKKIGEELLVYETGITELNTLNKKVKGYQSEFEKLKQNLDQEQVEFRISNTYEVGVFQCNDQSKFMTSDQFPGVVLLMDGSRLRSIVKINPSESKGFSVIESAYSETGKKVLCRLDPTCAQYLSQMESMYRREDLFPSVKDQLVSEKLKSVLSEMKSDQPNDLKVFQEFGRLGYYSIEELTKIFEPVIEMSKKISDVKTPKDYLVKLQKNIEDYKKTIFVEMENRSKKFPDATQKKNSETILNYLFSSKIGPAIESVVKSEFIDEFIQNKAFENCKINESSFAEYCRTAKLWRDRLKAIDQFTELKNLRPEDKCNPVVLRFPKKSTDENSVSCESNGTIDQLESNVKKVTEQIKK